MDVKIEQSQSCEATEVVIRCRTVDRQVEELISSIRLFDRVLYGKRGNEVAFIKPEDVSYIDTADERVFVYARGLVYETGLRLYEIEERFEGTSIMRVSKSAIVNILRIKCVVPTLNGRIIATLQTGERIVISRQYVAAFRKKIGL